MTILVDPVCLPPPTLYWKIGNILVLEYIKVLFLGSQLARDGYNIFAMWEPVHTESKLVQSVPEHGGHLNLDRGVYAFPTYIALEENVPNLNEDVAT